jgi:hypothetical protein
VFPKVGQAVSPADFLARQFLYRFIVASAHIAKESLSICVGIPLGSAGGTPIDDEMPFEVLQRDMEGSEAAK